MFGWVEGVRSRRGDTGARIPDLAASVRIFGREQAARISDLTENVRIFGREQAARIFGWSSAEVEERAKLLDRMIVLILHGLRTKTYEQFVATFSNPGHQPDALQLLSQRANFKMRMSPTCWYDAYISYGRNGTRSARMTGGGDDLGVCITVSSADDRIGVEFTALYGEESGRDAWAMVRTLARLPAYHRVIPAETSLEI
jgi:hypothetical protein